MGKAKAKGDGKTCIEAADCDIEAAPLFVKKWQETGEEILLLLHWGF